MTKQTDFIATKPTHRLYVVKGNGKSARWIEIGAAWQHADGDGYAISAQAFAIDGRIVMRKVTERKAREAA